VVFMIMLAAALPVTRLIGAGISRTLRKMLYDNAQLISLYAEAYTWQPDELYKDVVDETIAFVERELMSPDYGFYSALDADSEGVEGKFYSFTKAEIEAV
jgi:uncharacterized protein YyaL (SSP411 family)